MPTSESYDATDFVTSANHVDVLSCKNFFTNRRCHHKKLGTVAVTCLKYDENPKGCKKWESVLSSISCLHQLKHQNIVTVYGTVRWKNAFGIVHELSECTSLKNLLTESSPSDLSWDLRLRLATELSSAFAYLGAEKKLPPSVFCVESKDVHLTIDLRVKLCLTDGLCCECLHIIESDTGIHCYAEEPSKVPTTNLTHSLGVNFFQLATLTTTATCSFCYHEKAEKTIQDLKLHTKAKKKDLNLIKFMGNIIKTCMNCTSSESDILSAVSRSLANELAKRDQRDIVLQCANLVNGRLSSLFRMQRIPATVLKLSDFSHPFLKADLDPLTTDKEESIIDSQADSNIYHSMVIVGGLYTGNEVLEYIPSEKRINVLPELIDGRWAGGAAFLKDMLIVVGGRIDRAASNKVEGLDLTDPCSEWRRMTCMLMPRHSLGATVAKDKVYVTGGWTDPPPGGSNDENCKTIEEYDPDLNQWSNVGEILIPRGQHTAAAVKDQVYSIGGLGNHGEVLNSIECFNTRTRTSTFVTSMEVGKAGLSSVSCDNGFYVLGGHDENFITVDTVESYDVNEDRWDYSTTRMSRKRKAHGSCKVAGKIYAIAGVGWNDEGRTIEVFVEKGNYWSVVASMEKERIYPAVVAVERRKMKSPNLEQL
ncbi:unnamed protein product [Clavelina lepadiformis]|uniref:Serine-threonine/tyrosine-protein kinase catalytic domain-containing protein n=1 Tax=Clavelina lepadiformis TaxID=159417 RepID=A0ABP0G5B8_CLALP